jgi:hypothetical protein
MILAFLPCFCQAFWLPPTYASYFGGPKKIGKLGFLNKKTDKTNAPVLIKPTSNIGLKRLVTVL